MPIMRDSLYSLILALKHYQVTRDLLPILEEERFSITLSDKAWSVICPLPSPRVCLNSGSLSQTHPLLPSLEIKPTLH